MTCAEFSREFDILYNNITSNQAPELSEYEKSVFLTQAQESIVLEMYSGKFEETEDVASYLSNLVSEYTVTTSGNYIVLPEYIWFILYEKATIVKGTSTVELPVIPVSWDEFHRVNRNPFRTSNEHRIIRLSSVDTNQGDPKRKITLKLPTGTSLQKYNATYLKRPRPIIVADLNVEDYGTLVTIDNDYLEIDPSATQIPKQECLLNPNLHRSILSRAVQIAKSVWASN